ncbi:pyridoxal phosphate-dependent aminotransferase [Bacillus timonensis]|nr:pyridoxal phosphate-dependent aminotransferase [Bacillus timonensis]
MANHSYDFNHIINRAGTNSVKWDMTDYFFNEKGLHPMWVADMDFKAPDEVLEAFQKRVKHGIFGYTSPNMNTVEAISQWMEKQHKWKIESKWVTYSAGIVQALATAIQAFTKRGDKIIVQLPVYYPFFQLIENNGRIVVKNKLKVVNGPYEMDFNDLISKIDNNVKMLFLCNPHNPGGKVWKKEDLIKLGEICATKNILIISDDIHHDLVIGETPYTPLASLSESLAQHVITCASPSKSFNLAGLQASAIIIPNENYRKLFTDTQHAQGFFTLNTFGIIGMEQAYLHGGKWLEELKEHLRKNVSIIKNYLHHNIPKLTLMDPESTYLAWIDCRSLGLSDEEIQRRLIEKGKIALEPGSKFGEGGEGYVRLNFACPTSTLLNGLEKISQALTDEEK